MAPNREECADTKDVQEDARVAPARIQRSHVKNVTQKLSKEPLLIVLIPSFHSPNISTVQI